MSDCRIFFPASPLFLPTEKLLGAAPAYEDPTFRQNSASGVGLSLLAAFTRQAPRAQTGRSIPQPKKKPGAGRRDPRCTCDSNRLRIKPSRT